YALGGAAADGDVLVGVVVQAVERPRLGGDGLAQGGGAPGDGVLVVAVLDGPAGGVLDGLRRVEVGHALAEVDGVVLLGQPGHLGDDRLGEVVDAAGQHALLGGWGGGGPAGVLSQRGGRIIPEEPVSGYTARRRPSRRTAGPRSDL